MIDKHIVGIQFCPVGLNAVVVRHRRHHVRSGQDVDRTAGVMGENGHVIRLSHRGDLLQFRDTAGPGHIWHDEVGQLVLENRHEFPSDIGSPNTLPPMSQSAISIALIMFVVAPRDPM